jgi:hypothetical protein
MFAEFRCTTMPGMAMGKCKRDRQPPMWVTTTDLPTAESHPFYRRLNQLLREEGFDDFAEAQCVTFDAETMGRPGLPPGTYFRLLLMGYFEGIQSERGIASRAADSLALRDFLGVGLEGAIVNRSRRHARCGPRQSSPHPSRTREAALTTPRRTGRTQLRSHV